MGAVHAMSGLHTQPRTCLELPLEARQQLPTGHARSGDLGPLTIPRGRP